MKHDQDDDVQSHPSPNKRREIHVVLRNAETPRGTSLERAVQMAKVFAGVATPLVIALVGWRVQEGLSARTLNKEYMNIAVQILTQDPSAVDSELRVWAVDLLNKHSPVAFGEPLYARFLAADMTFLGRARLADNCLVTEWTEGSTKHSLSTPIQDGESLMSALKRHNEGVNEIDALRKGNETTSRDDSAVRDP